MNISHAKVTVYTEESYTFLELINLKQKKPNVLPRLAKLARLLASHSFVVLQYFDMMVL